MVDNLSLGFGPSLTASVSCWAFGNKIELKLKSLFDDLPFKLSTATKRMGFVLRPFAQLVEKVPN